MIILISGASHTGKTLLAQKLLEHYHYPVLSLDLLKMGLIRGGQTSLTPEDDEALTLYLWNIVKEIIKTAIENNQSLIIEGCYIPFDWKKDFNSTYLVHITYCCLIMSERYIMQHSDALSRYANAIEQRLCDEVSIPGLIKDNNDALVSCRKYSLPYFLIDDTYNSETIKAFVVALEKTKM